MQYNFDQVINRENTHSVKLEAAPKGSLPLWVADMDFPCAQPIIQALHERVDRQIFGYTRYDNEELKNATTGWFKRRYDWEIDPASVFFSPGVVPAICFLVQGLTKEGDGIIIQPPVYHPFAFAVENNGRKLVRNPLVQKDNTYRMDYEDLEAKLADPGNKGLILCSPHNPVGRVWTKEELLKVVELCKKYDKWIISDEIHCDLTRTGVVHHPLLKLAPEYAHRIIACTAPSKTFNLAGMQISNIVITNPEYQEKWKAGIEGRNHIDMASPWGITANIAAYNECEDWLDQLRCYLDGNISYVKEYLTEHLPKAKVADCQGTYLMWVDFNAYCESKEELERLMQEAGVKFNQGYVFGPEGSGFERINVASPRCIIEECMKRLQKAFPEAETV